MARTKIVCTLGPASQEPLVLRGMMAAGMDVARINFSHGDRTSQERQFLLVRQLADEVGQPVAVMADLQGRKLRVGVLPGGRMLLGPGDRVVLSSSPQPEPGEIPLPHPELVDGAGPGQRLLLDDGAFELVVEEKRQSALACRVVRGGELHSNKGINAPGVALRLPPLSEKDRADVEFAVTLGVDYLALSFVRRAEDVEALRSFLGPRAVPIIAKIEKVEALQAFEEILAAADGIMVARGDLGVETAPEHVPLAQKRILQACNRVGKPGITATQMLQSMIEHAQPTRAEASDVANAVLDGTDAVMLSGETAVGAHPVEAVQMMDRIVRLAEQELDPEACMRRAEPADTASEAIARATVAIAGEVKAAAILTSTISGTTARLVARHRPRVPIVAATPLETTYRRMALVWGVCPLLVPAYDSTDKMYEITTRSAVEAGLLKPGDVVVITAGVPAGGEGGTNMLKVHVV